MWRRATLLTSEKQRRACARSSLTLFLKFSHLESSVHAMRDDLGHLSRDSVVRFSGMDEAIQKNTDAFTALNKQRSLDKQKFVSDLGGCRAQLSLLEASTSDLVQKLEHYDSCG